MLAKKRNKKLGRMSESDLKEVSQKNVISDSDRIKTKEELIMKFTNSIENSQDETKEKLTEEQIEELIKTEVSIFCRKYGIDVNNKTIFNFAKVKGLDSKWQDMLLKNPYVLMKMENVGFVRADSIAMRLSFPHDHKYRILAFVGQSLEDLSKGSTILNLGTTMVYMGKHLNIKDNNRIVDVVLNQADDTYKLLDYNYRVTTDMTQARYLTKTVWYETERDFYKLLKAVEKEPVMNVDSKVITKVKSNFEYELNEGQNAAIDEILNNNINVLTGLGGTGKSTITKAILEILIKHSQDYTCLAPTGIASKNFTKLTGVHCETVHRRYYSRKGIETSWLILEESSMLACDHIKMILKMLGKNKPKLLLIGDLHQLSPINPSAPFRDLFSLIEKGKVRGNIIELTEIMRASNESFIPHLSKMFTKYGKYNKSVEKNNNAGVYFYKLNKELPSQILDIISEHNLNFKTTYVLSPQNVGEYGCHKINEFINEVVADSKIAYKDKFRTININSELLQNKNNSELDIYNGERITLKKKLHFGDEATYICEKLDEGTEVMYSEELLLSQTILSYGLTVHKTQSLTVENVILVCSMSHYHMLTANLVYTGMSRASKKLIIIHDEGALAMASNKTEIDKRVTFLGQIAKI